MTPAPNFTPEKKRDVLLELFAGRKMAEISREYQVSPTAVYRWRDQFIEAGLVGLQGSRVSTREAMLERENEKLKEIVGELSVANYALKRGTGISTGNRGGRR